MKKISIIMVIAITLALLNSCSEDFLTKEPKGSTSENVFYNEKGVEALVVGCYGMIGGGNIGWGASIQNWTFGSIASDDAYKGSEITDQVPANDVERWSVQSVNNYPAEKWAQTIGRGVDRTNKTLRIINIAIEQGNMDEATANKYRAEVRFIRALNNFEARLVFGDYIPILTEDTEDPTLVSNENPEGAVLNHIISDLQFAWENLPETQDQVGRPTKYAAMALAARAYLQDLKYAEAKPLLENIISSGKYSLMPNFEDNFLIAKNNNAESIFEIQASVNDGGGYGSYNAEMGIGLNWPHGSDIGMCCGFHQPSQNLVNAYKVDANGLPLFDTFNNTDLKNDQGIDSADEFEIATDPVDPRLDFTVSRRGIPYKDWGINRGSNWIRKQTEGGPYLPASKPFMMQSERYTLSDGTGGWMSGVNANNYRYLRYTHILLWRAEVAAAEGDLELARTYVNMIRERAGNKVVMGKVLINKLPASVYPWGEEGDIDWDQPAANYNIGLYPAFANANQAMTAVQWEQRLEFATEGFRFFDLRRWDNLPNKIGGKSMADVLNNFVDADLRIREFMGLGGKSQFTENDKYQPVPQTQLDLQPGVLVQRPGY
jgi:hypothetical protein